MKIITTLFAVFLHVFLFSQEWTILKSNEKYSIEYSKIDFENKSDGINHQRIIFQYKNLTNTEIKLTFNRSISYEKSGNLTLQDKTYSITIPANGSISFNDSNSTDKTYYIFSKDLKGTIKRSLTNFDITNIQIQ